MRRDGVSADDGLYMVVGEAPAVHFVSGDGVQAEAEAMVVDSPTPGVYDKASAHRFANTGAKGVLYVDPTNTPGEAETGEDG
jgi:hypothetical protein